MDYSQDLERPIVTLRGQYTTVDMVNPFKCRFIAHYEDSSVVKGNNLFDTGWKELPDGIVKLQYELSNGIVVDIPSKFKSYLHLVDASQSLFGVRMFHNVFVKGESFSGDIISYQIVLRESGETFYKIGDVLVSKDACKLASEHWKSAKW